MALKTIRKICVLLFFTLLVSPIFADEGFLVKKIEVDGLQKINLQTVLEYLPVHEGQVITAEDTAAIISTLYKTGFFSDVSLSRRGNTLVINVIERSTIGYIKISGNKVVKTKDLMDAMKHGGIAEGEAFDQATLSGMKQALLDQYYALGRYNATVETTVIPQSRNRVEVDIHIYEGKIAKVKEINIIGNKAFKTSELLKNFELSNKHWWNFWSSSDDYSTDKLQKDLESLRSFYYNRGYLRFSIDSSQVTITPNRKDVYITIHVTEGDVYRVKGYALSGNLLGQEDKLEKYIKLKPGSVFSRQKVLGISEGISRFYGDQGYADAAVNIEPNIDDATKQVFVTFVVNPGPRIYVRRIDYTGNTKTADYVLRRETRQMEGGLYSISKMDETKRRLNNLGYIDNVDVKVEPVPNVADQVDLNYTLKETSSTTASAQVGYSDTYGLLYGANITQKNFRGSGKSLSLGFNNSQYVDTYTFTYFNPYFTDSGISQSFNVYFQQTTPGNDTNVAPYTLDAYGASFTYAFPLSEYDAFTFGYGYEYLETKTTTPSQQISDFIEEHGSHFNNVKLIFGWSHNTFDRAVFPTRGFNQYIGTEVGVPVLPNSLDYYKFNYNATLYHPLWKGVIVALNTNLGYGNGYDGFDELPFFKNYFAGGMGTVRGYQSNTLGPRDSNNNPFGGNVLATGSFNLIIPNPISERVRTSVYLDAGNVYDNQLSIRQLRTSAGVEVDWMSPIAPIKLSLGKALNAKSGDLLEAFQFSLGTSF